MTTTTRHPFRGTNFMTPRIIDRRKVRSDLWAELSRGEGFDHEPIFGVTFMVYRDGAWRESWRVDGPESRMFHDEDGARQYMDRGGCDDA